MASGSANLPLSPRYWLQGQLCGQWSGSEGPWQQGKSRRKDKLTLKQIQDVVQFIMNYAGVCTSLSRCLCLSVCECKREREREREGEKEREGMFKKRYIYINVHALVHCTQQCITFIHNLCLLLATFNGSMSKLTRLQRHAAAWESAWLQGLWCEALAIQHNQAHPLGALSPGSSKPLDEGSGIPNLHSALSAASPQCSGDEADE